MLLDPDLQTDDVRLSGWRGGLRFGLWWIGVYRFGGHSPLASLRCAKGAEAPPFLPSTLGFLLSQE